MNQSAYLIGIKGVGMSALAQYLSQAGFDVEGSDNTGVYVTDEILQKAKIKVYEGFDKNNLTDKKPDHVIVSAAYGLDNPEVKEAHRRHLKVMYYSEALGMITADKKVIAVSGVHGKTTTTALAALLLTNANLSPSFLIGAAKTPNLEANAHMGDGHYFILEADEYRKSPSDDQSKFLDLSPEIAIISSIELDHPDIFSSIEDVYKAFYRLACRVSRQGLVILCTDYPKCRKLKQSLVDRNFQTYGFDSGADWQVVDAQEGDSTKFSLKYQNNIFGPYTINLPGQHNILNAAAVIVLAHHLNLGDQIIRKTLNEFTGVQRRFEKVGQVGDIMIFDDYAHHPTAISKTLEAVKAKFPQAKIWCVFQPHTYSRTQALLKEFGQAFGAADNIVVTDIYTSEREKEGKITTQDLVHEIEKNHRHVRYFSNFEKIEKHLHDFVKGPAVVMTIGAGDIYKLGRSFLVDLQKEVK